MRLPWPGSPPPRPLRTAAKSLQHGGRAENTVITQQKRPASTELHYVATKTVYQTWHVEVQQQTDVDPAHAHGRVKPGHLGPVRSGTAWIGRMMVTALISRISSPATTISALKPSPTSAPLYRTGIVTCRAKAMPASANSRHRHNSYTDSNSPGPVCRAPRWPTRSPDRSMVSQEAYRPLREHRALRTFTVLKIYKALTHRHCMCGSGGTPCRRRPQCRGPGVVQLTEFAIRPIVFDTRRTAYSSCRRRSASTTLIQACDEVVDGGPSLAMTGRALDESGVSRVGIGLRGGWHSRAAHGRSQKPTAGAAALAAGGTNW